MAKKKEEAKEESVTPEIDGLSVREIELNGAFKIVEIEHYDPSTEPSDTLCQFHSEENREVIGRLNEIHGTPLENVGKLLDELIADQSRVGVWYDTLCIGPVSFVEKYIGYLATTFHFAKNYLESVHNIPVPSDEFSTWEERLFASESDGQKGHASTEENLIYEAISIIGTIKYVGEVLKVSINNSVAPLTLDSSLQLADAITSIELSCAALNLKDTTKKSRAAPIKRAFRIKSPERPREKEQEIAELRERAKKIAIKLKRDGISTKNITVKRICEDLLREKFSSGIPFESRWGTVEGMRSLLKREHHPTKNQEFRDAKSTRGKFDD